jgi:hypothetical protein
MTELSLLPGSYDGTASGVNDAGVAVGTSHLNEGARAVRWQHWRSATRA